MEVSVSILGPVISAFVKKLYPELEGVLRRDHYQQITEWNAILSDLSPVLQYAEDNIENKPEIKGWVKDLVDLICEVEDTIEVFNYQALKRKVESSPGTMKKMFRFPGSFLKNRKLSKKLSDITKRLQKLKDRKSFLNLLSEPVEVRAMVGRPPSSSLAAADRCILGRDDDKREILNLLNRESEERIEVIPIVGMGGLGKTTLARYAYNDATSFDIKVWVCVSLDFDIYRITLQIMKGVSPQCNVEGWGLNGIQEELSRSLSNKRFLMVLDDLWNEEYENWEALRPPFSSGSVGSRIIVTTRSETVAKIVKTSDAVIAPKTLSEENCFSLLCYHAGVVPNGTSYKVTTAKEIAKRCSGLPLAAITMGGVLRCKDTLQEWRSVLESKSWRFSKDGDVDVMSVLKMSYNDLSPQLKRCFSSFSMLPEDYEFREEEIVLLWIGGGVVQWVVGKTKKQVADECFRELLSRSLFSFEDDSGDDPKYYKMHDLIRDVAIEVAGNRFIGRNDNVKEMMKSLKTTRDIFCHSSIAGEIFDSILRESQDTLPLRSLLVDGPHMDDNLPDDRHFSKVKYLRLLSLRHMPKTFPKSIGKMKLLRYLNLLRGEFHALPKSLTSLYNLQILILFKCWELKELPGELGNLLNLIYLDVTSSNIEELPVEIGKLQNLSHLKIYECTRLKKLPVEIGKLQSLCHLHMCHCSEIEELPIEIGKLQSLSHLTVKACSKLKRLPVEIGKLKNLCYLNMTLCLGIEELPIEIGKLQNLCSLYISGCGIKKLPVEIGKLQNLCHFEMAYCRQIKELPVEIGELQNLCFLNISGCEIKEIPVEIRMLQNLKLQN